MVKVPNVFCPGELTAHRKLLSLTVVEDPALCPRHFPD